MKTARAPLNGGWTGFRGAGGDDAIDILDTIEVPIVVLRRDATIVGFNKAATDVLGFSSLDIGRAARDNSVLAGLPHLEEQCNRVLLNGSDHHVNYRDRDRSFVVRISSYSKRDRQAAGTVVTFTNVTALRASIDQAIYEREFTKAIINTVADPLVVLSAEQRIQSGNRAFYTMFGVSRDETQGRPVYELGNGALELAALRTQLSEMLDGGDTFHPVEVDCVLAGMGQRTLMLNAHPLSFPGHSQRRALLTFQDITVRRKAELAKDLRSKEELRRSEAFLAEGQRLSLTGSFSWRVATDEVKWSEQLYRIYEFEIGVPVTLELIRTRVHPEDVSLLEKMKMVDQSRGGGHDFEWHYRLMMPDRSIKYMHAVAHATRDQDGQLEYIAAVQDVTSRRLSEEALGKARSELAHVSRVTTLGAMTASIAHEVNQPLAGIMTNANTCLRMLASESPNVDGARETARRTIRDANRASEVITRLRALFAKKDSTTEPLDLNETTREVIALVSNDLQRSRVILDQELADDLPPIEGDRVQLQQVILNLLLNAVDAMSGVDDRPRRLVISTQRDEGDRVRVAIRDAGVGFDLRNVDQLFDAFYTTKSYGMGIGLSVSRSIVESHHGRLWAELNDGPGATFSFSVPRVQSA